MAFKTFAINAYMEKKKEKESWVIKKNTSILLRRLDSFISDFMLSIDHLELKNIHMNSRNQMAMKMKAELTIQGNFYYVH